MNKKAINKKNIEIIALYFGEMVKGYLIKNKQEGSLMMGFFFYCAPA